MRGESRFHAGTSYPSPISALKAALGDAFDYARLGIMTHDHLGIDLESITVARNKTTAIHDLVTWAQRNSRVADLVRAALASSTNQALRRLPENDWGAALQGLDAAVGGPLPLRGGRRRLFIGAIVVAALVAAVPLTSRAWRKGGPQAAADPRSRPTEGAAPRECRLAITSPAPGADVGREGVVRGKAQITRGAYVWVLAHRRDFSGRWWPQGRAPLDVRNGSWLVTAGYGAPQDVGHAFEIAVVAVDEVTSLGFARWELDSRARGDYQPIALDLHDVSVPGCAPEVISVAKSIH